MTQSTWQDYFQPGETLLWEGAPRRGVHGLAKIVGLAAFGLPFLIIGVAIFVSGVGMVFGGKTGGNTGMGLLFAAFSIPFAGVGALMVFGQWYAASRAHTKVRYALSTRTAFIATSYWTKRIETYPILPDTAATLEKDRTSDTVWFHTRSERDSDGDRTTTKIGFENNADGDAVLRLIRSIQMGTP